MCVCVVVVPVIGSTKTHINFHTFKPLKNRHVHNHDIRVRSDMSKHNTKQADLSAL